MIALNGDFSKEKPAKFSTKKCLKHEPKHILDFSYALDLYQQTKIKIMKKQLLIALAALSITANAQQGERRVGIENTPSKVQNYNPTIPGGIENRNIQPVDLHANNKGMSPQYFNDVIIENSTYDQRNVKISAAFNGWLYAAYSTSNTSTGAGGITIRKSRNNGITWTTLDSYQPANTKYPTFDIVVAGTDTNNLILYLAGVNVNTSTGVNYLFFDKYNARTNAFMGSWANARNYGTNRVNDIAVASDYKFPAFGATPYSIGMLYSLYTPTIDSVIFVLSGNGGTGQTYSYGVYGTGYYTRKVDLAYGRSLNGSNGRYFGVWERLASSSARNGNIYTSRSASTVGGAWIAPKNLDSLSSTMIGLCRNPVIAVQHNNINNDSAATTAVVLTERDFGGTATDYDVLGFFNKKAHYTLNWQRLDVINTGEKDNQPHIAYDPANNNFLTVYHDSTNHKLPYCVNGMNLTNPNTWGYITTQYNDLTTNIKNPYPRVDIDPSVVKTVHVWNSEGTAKGIALFDAENLSTAVKDATESTVSADIYPNPASNWVKITLNLKNVNDVSMEIYDAVGNVMKREVYNNQSNIEVKNINISDLADGVYILKLSSDKASYSKKLVKASN